MEECKRMGLQVLGPDVNESFYKFTVNDNYAVRFGMGAVKGVGANAVDTIVQNRKDENYKSIFDLAKKIDLRAANKKAFESLALAGGFDCFTNTHRAQYFHIEGEGITFLEKAVRYGSKFQENENSSQVSLFGDASEVQIAEPIVPPCEEWGTMEKLSREKEVVGIYISGHPLDDHKYTLLNYCKTKLESLKELEPYIGKTLSIGGIVTSFEHRTAKNGKGWGSFVLEGYDENYEFRIFDKAYLDFRNLLGINQFVYIKIAIKSGWVNQETGKKSEPRIEFLDVQQLHDVLGKFSKNVSIKLDIEDVSEDLIMKLNEIFKENKGNKSLNFEIFEIEKTKQIIEVPIKAEVNEENIQDEENLEAIEMEIPIVEVQNQVRTKVLLPSRKLKIDISKEFLEKLEKMKIKFSLN